MSCPERIFKTFIVLLLFSLAFSKGFINLISNPPFQTADEPMYLEAAMVEGRFFPNVFSLDENTCKIFQKPILTVMSNHFFFDRIGIPEPYPMPDLFRNVPLIRDAPSKIGRQPLFFLLIGLPIRLFTNGILEALYLARSINLAFAILALFLFYRLLKIRYNNDNDCLIFALSCFVLHPAFWHLGSSMTSESLKILLVCIGLFLSVDTNRKGLTIWRAVLVIIWFFLVVATTWTLAPLALTLVGPILFNFSAKLFTYDKSFGRATLVILTMASILFVLSVSDKKLLYHEIVNFYSGWSNLISGKTLCAHSLRQLSMSFWAGFNWLTVPVPSIARLIFTGISTAWCLAFFSYIVTSPVKRRNDLLYYIVVFTVLLWSVLIAIRASANEPSIQGRYFFPILPIIILGVTEGIRLIKKPILRFYVFLSLIGLNITGDFSANILGWIHYQHIDYAGLKEPVASWSSFSWLESTGTYHVLDIRHPYASAFLRSGWYPAESENSHRWMMNKAKICLPFIFSQDTLLHLDISPFLPSDNSICDLLLEWNDIPIGSKRLISGWHTYTFGIRKEWIDSKINMLTLTCKEAFSPKDFGQSDDSRMLSIAFRRLEIEPLHKYGVNQYGKSGWFLTPERTTLLRFVPGDKIRINRCEPEGCLLTVHSDGTIERLWWADSQEIAIGEIRDIQSIELKKAKQSRVLENYAAYELSVKNLPNIFSDIYYHFVIQFIWVFIAISVFVLFYCVFLPVSGT